MWPRWHCAGGQGHEAIQLDADAADGRWDCWWHGVLGFHQVCTQRPCGTQLHGCGERHRQNRRYCFFCWYIKFIVNFFPRLLWHYRMSSSGCFFTWSFTWCGHTSPDRSTCAAVGLCHVMIGLPLWEHQLTQVIMDQRAVKRLFIYYCFNIIGCAAGRTSSS